MPGALVIAGCLEAQLSRLPHGVVSTYQLSRASPCDCRPEIVALKKPSFLCDIVAYAFFPDGHSVSLQELPIVIAGKFVLQLSVSDAILATFCH